jgi:hypothetical protein
MNANDYLIQFFNELEHSVDGHGTRHVISTTRTGELEVRLGAGDWYWATKATLDDDPIKAAQVVAGNERYFPNQI